MHPWFRRTALAALSASLIACSHSALRLPASARPKYNPERVQLLRNAAAGGLFMLVSDAVVRDVPVRAAGELCRKTGDGPWVDELFSVLQIFQREPALLRKIHLIELRRGDHPLVEVSKDLDGAVSLVVSYAKVETHEKVLSPADLPCSATDAADAGNDVVETHFDYPALETVAETLRKQTDRPSVQRLNVDSRFPLWLAERLTIFRLTPEITFEKTPAGEPLLPWVMNRLATEVDQLADSEQLEYWLAEITHRSRMGTSLKFFGLKKDSTGARGVQVDSLGKVTRKMMGGSDPTYLYLSYRVENNNFVLAGLPELGQCLGDLSATYRSAMSLMSTFDSDPESFLYPGYHCQNNEGL